jgi:hypothetical protein
VASGGTGAGTGAAATSAAPRGSGRGERVGASAVAAETDTTPASAARNASRARPVIPPRPRAAATPAPAEIRRVGILARLDDAPADRARASEIGVQVIAVASANGALKREQLLGEPPEDFQRRVLVGQEHVAPHSRVRGRDPGEIAETGGGILDDLAVGDAAQVVGHAHHRVGDQVRGVRVTASTRSW